MRINSGLGYKPVTYSELTDDEAFWKGCQSCVNFEILQSKSRTNCLCTAMLYDPAKDVSFIPLPLTAKETAVKVTTVQNRWMRHRVRPLQDRLNGNEASSTQV
jgi:hypothetical protein